MNLPERSSGSHDTGGRSQKRRRAEITAGPTRRSTNACHRCKSKKLKCHFIGQIQDKCASCGRSDSDCVFDVPSDGIPRGSEYVASLEARIASLESELRSVRAFSSPPDQLIPDDGSRQLGGHVSTSPGRRARAVTHSTRSHNSTKDTFSFTQLVESSLQNSPESTSEITSFNMLQGGTTTSEMQASTLPELPSQKVGHLLLETVYLYIQARYCIVDWVQLREWHQRRETICYSTKEDDLDSQTGAYFIWIIYAIGAGFVPNPEYPPKAYFARALKYLHPILTLQNSTTVQALLCLCQFHFRTTGGPSVWHLSGIIMRLCVELGYHRKASSDVMDPLAIELQKRFFWCAYCFDRLVSTMARRPFGIHDLDIDVETPVNVNIECTDSEQLEYLQSRQRAGEDGCQIGGLTSMSSALHHLEFYRLKSRIMTRLFGPHALPPTYEDVQELLSKLDKWMATAPRNCPNSLPQQSEIRKQGFYLQAVLLTMRPVLIQQSVDEHLLLLCAGKAADACEVGRQLSISPETHPSLTDLYQSFYCGITLLQCLALQPAILPARRIARAILACSSTLSVYTRQFPVGAPFLDIFDKLSDRFLGAHDDLTRHTPTSMLRLRTFLGEIMSKDPSQVSRILNSWSPDEGHLYETSAHDDALTVSHFPMTGEFFSAMGISDVAMPFDMPFDMLSMSGDQPDMTDLWGGL